MKKSRNRRLSQEPLEQRLLLTSASSGSGSWQDRGLESFWNSADSHLAESHLVLLVDTVVDESDGDYSAGDLSLREAVELANANLGLDVVEFDTSLMGATIVLSLIGSGTTALPVHDSILLQGLGATNITIDASGIDPTPGVTNGDGMRVFEISGGVTAELSGLTLTGGDVAGGGGAMRSSGNLTLDAVTVSGNAAARGGAIANYGSLAVEDSILANNEAAGTGGAIHSAFGNVTLGNSQLANNSASSGGTLRSYAGTTDVFDSIITGNTATDRGGGVNVRGYLLYQYYYDPYYGGFYYYLYEPGVLNVERTTVAENSAEYGGGIAVVEYSNARIADSTVSGNSATGGGGGMYFATGATPNYPGSTDVDHVTVSGNRADGSGGGLYDRSRNGRIFASTITGNRADADFDGVGYGGGLVTSYSGFYGGYVGNSIVAGNSSTSGNAPDWFDPGGTLVPRFSLVGSNQGTSLVEAPQGMPDADGNLIGGPISGTIFPVLDTLRDNGGPTFTHRLGIGSPALDSGDPAISSTSDQRGAPFGRVDAARADMGAFENQSLGSPQIWTVDTLRDESDGDYAPGDLSLREAIGLSNGNLGFVDTIRFDPNLSGGSVELDILMPKTVAALVVHDSIVMDGLGDTLLQIDGSQVDPTIAIENGDGARVFDLSLNTDTTLSGLTITGGNSTRDGGAIRVQRNASLLVRDTTITGNSARDGGAISNYGSLQVEDSRLTSNQSTFTGGAVRNGFGGDLILLRSVLDGNMAGSQGGAISSTYASTTISGATISNNLAAQDGGGIWGFASTTELVDSVVTGNSASGQGGGIAGQGTYDIEYFYYYSYPYYYYYGIPYTEPNYLNIARSTISDNAASSGGGIASLNVTYTSLVDATISGNIASQEGGGIRQDYYPLYTIYGNVAGGRIDATNTTISGNLAQDRGGAIYSSIDGIYGAFHLGLNHTTITGNTANLGDGGGLAVYGNANFSLDHAILADNRTNLGNSDDFLDGSTYGALNVDYSLIGSNVGNGLAEAPVNLPDAAGNLIGGPTFGLIDPQLMPLALNGGPTQTHLPLPGSPVINAGAPLFSGPPDNDQRGAPFDRVADGRIDIGSIEVQMLMLAGDFNGDGVYDCTDVDALVANIAVGPTNPAIFDLTNDGLVDTDDLGAWLSTAGGVNLGPGRVYLTGDANLDGVVDVSDFNEWNAHKFTATPAWCSGDFTADGFVDVSDFNEWNAHKFQSSDLVESLVRFVAVEVASGSSTGRDWSQISQFQQSGSRALWQIGSPHDAALLTVVREDLDREDLDVLGRDRARGGALSSEQWLEGVRREEGWMPIGELEFHFD